MCYHKFCVRFAIFLCLSDNRSCISSGVEQRIIVCILIGSKNLVSVTQKACHTQYRAVDLKHRQLIVPYT